MWATKIEKLTSHSTRTKREGGARRINDDDQLTVVLATIVAEPNVKSYEEPLIKITETQCSSFCVFQKNT